MNIFITVYYHGLTVEYFTVAKLQTSKCNRFAIIATLQKKLHYKQPVKLKEVATEKKFACQESNPCTDRATNDIAAGQRIVYEIADRLIFSAPNHLMRFFRQQTGKTVNEFLEEVESERLS